MNIKALISSAFIGAASIFGGVTSAEAAGHYCYYNTNDAHLCVYNVRGDRYNKTYDLNINGRYVGKQSVWCNPAHRYTYKANANGIACFEFN